MFADLAATRQVAPSDLRATFVLRETKPDPLDRLVAAKFASKPDHEGVSPKARITSPPGDLQSATVGGPHREFERPTVVFATLEDVRAHLMKPRNPAPWASKDLLAVRAAVGDFLAMVGFHHERPRLSPARAMAASMSGSRTRFRALPNT